MLREQPKSKGRPRRKPVRGVSARNRLAEDNVKLVSWAVTRFFRKLDKGVERSYPRDDARDDAWVGFLRACELWEQDRGSLSAYAWWWMRQEMQCGLQVALNLIHNPLKRPEARVPCGVKDNWTEDEEPQDGGEDVVVVICRMDVLAALEEALDHIERRQALAIRMRLAGSTWTEVARKLHMSIPSARNVEQEGQCSLRKELAHIEELV